RLGGLSHILGEGLEFLARAGQLASLHAVRQRSCLSLQFCLHIREELRVLGSFGFVAFLIANLVKRRSDYFLLALRDLVIILFAPAATSASLLLGLRIFLFE